MLRAKIIFKISTFRFNFVKFDFHATSESTFRFWLATGQNVQRTNSYAHRVDLYYKGAIAKGLLRPGLLGFLGGDF